MAKKFKLICILSIICFLISNLRLEGKNDIKNISILPFEMNIQAPEGKELSSYIKDSLEKLIIKDYKKEFIIRKSTREILKQFEEQLKGIRKEKDVKIIEIDYFIVGNLSKIDRLYELDIRAINIENGAVISGNGMSFSSRKDIKNALKKLFSQLTQDLNKKSNVVNTNPSISLFSFSAMGKKANEIGLDVNCSFMLSANLPARSRFNVVEAKELNKILQEKELLFSGLVERKKHKEFRKILNVDIGIELSVAYLADNLITFNLKIIDAITGRLLFIIYGECNNPINIRSTIYELIRKLDNKFFNMSKLEIQSRPRNAKIYLDDIHVGSSPLLITDIESGKYELKLKKSEYSTHVKDIEVLSGKKLILNIKLQSQEKQYYEMGKKKEDSRKWQEAIGLYMKFYEKYPDTKNSLDALYRVAHIYHYNLKKYSQSIKIYKKIINSSSDTWLMSESYYGIGECLLKINKENEAQKNFKMLMQEFPETTAAQFAKEQLRKLGE